MATTSAMQIIVVISGGLNPVTSSYYFMWIIYLYLDFIYMR